MALAFLLSSRGARGDPCHGPRVLGFVPHVATSNLCADALDDCELPSWPLLYILTIAARVSQTLLNAGRNTSAEWQGQRRRPWWSHGDPALPHPRLRWFPPGLVEFIYRFGKAARGASPPLVSECPGGDRPDRARMPCRMS